MSKRTTIYCPACGVELSRGLFAKTLLEEALREVWEKMAPYCEESHEIGCLSGGGLIGTCTFESCPKMKEMKPQ